MNIEDQPPVISLGVPLQPVVESGGVYNEPGATAMDECDGDISGQIQVSGTLNTGALGDHLLSYTVSDSFGNPATPVVRTVTVVDTTPPVITLTGGASITACQGQPFTDPGTTVTDNCDTGLTATLTGTVDTTTPGDYTLTYNATDTTGNHAIAVQRTVTVEVDDPPTVLLVGERVIVHPCNTPFVDQGANVVDDCDPDGVIYASPIDTSHAGAHVLTYSKTDAANHTIAVERLVIVDCAEDVSAQIPDGDLRDGIKAALGKQPANPVSPAELRGLDELTLPGKEITSITGLLYCINLEKLDLHGNCILHISPLRFMENLSNLNLHDNDIESVVPLQSCEALDILYLSRNPITDIEPLKRNPGIQSTPIGGSYTHWDRISLNFTDVDITDIDQGAHLAALRGRGVAVWEPAPNTISTSPPKSAQALNTAQIVLYWNETSGVSVESIDILTGFNGSLYSVHGENGTLRITDTAGNTYEAGLTFPTVIPVCGGDDPLAELPPAEVVTENWAVVTMPIDGVVTNLEYAEPGGSYVPLGLPTSTIPKQGNCTPFETNGYPIPITKQLIHGDPNLRDDRAYVIALVGDAFTLAQLGDPFLSESDVPVDGFPNNRIELSKASADTARFLLQHEPFREYAGKIKIYRIDFISNSGTISTAQVPQDTAFKLQRSASGSIYATNASLISVALARTGLAVNNIGMLANTDKGYGSGSPPIATYINTENSRRAVALHEFGHSIVWLQDEYECRQGNCSIPASGASVARINTVIRGSGIPSRAEVPWAHWLGRREDGTVVAECANHALGEPYAACQANWDCQCQSYSPGNCLHLPTCETGGDVDISGRHYGHGGKWLIPLSSTDAISWPPPPSATLVVEPWPEPSDIGAVVGLYEGGAYKPERAYRPMLRCRMRSDDDVAYVVAKVISDTPNPYVEQQVAYIGVRTMEFCPVCREALTAKILEAAGVALGFSPAQEEIVPVSGLDSVFSVQLPGFPTQGHSVSVISWRKNDVVIPGSQGLTQLAIPGDTLAADDVIGVTLVDNTGWILPDNPQQPGYDTVQEQLQWRVRVGAP